MYRADEYGLVPRDSSLESDPKRLGRVELSYENPSLSSDCNGTLSKMGWNGSLVLVLPVPFFLLGVEVLGGALVGVRGEGVAELCGECLSLMSERGVGLLDTPLSLPRRDESLSANDRTRNIVGI